MRRPPKASLLNAFRAERVDHALVIGEAVDNCFDAEARQVVIRYDDRAISFRDDGIGLNEERLDALLTLGGHAKMPSTALGRYGIGIKIQAVNAGNLLQVDSTAVDKDGYAQNFVIEVDWLKIERTDWDFPEPKSKPTLVGAATGTLIQISHLRPAIRRSNAQIVDDIARRFHPALSQGAVILFNDLQVPLLAEPELIDRVERALVFGERRADIVAGILRDPSKLWGVNIAYRHRTIMMNDTFGTDDFGGVTKMFARITLSDTDNEWTRWHLGRFKDQIADQRQNDELEEAVAQILKPILEKCQSQAFDARIDGIEEWINLNLPPDKVAARPKRKKKVRPEPGPPLPPRPPKPKPEISPETAKLGSGPLESRQSQKGKLKVEFVDALDGGDIAEYKHGRPDRVLMAKNNSTIAGLLQYRDEKFARKMLRDLALIFYAQATYQYDLFQKFGGLVSQLLEANAAEQQQELQE